MTLTGVLTVTSACAAVTTTLNTFTTTVWVVNRVHGSTTDLWTDTEPSVASCFTEVFQAVLWVRDFTD